MKISLKYFLHALERPVLILVPLTLLICAIWQPEQSALLGVLTSVVAIIVLFAGYETSQPTLRQVIPAVVLGALAAAGRILFALIPDFKPVVAITIMAGAFFGRPCGFMAGSLAALISNAFFGQGVWTAWQMYAWGTIGYLSAVLAEHKLLQKSLVRDLFGFLSCLLYGVILDTWNLISFVRPIAWQTAVANYASGLPYTLIQGIATICFLHLIWKPWGRRFRHIRSKYDLMH